ncbi:MAG: ABC transporter permease [Chloroflexota bacterium]
MAEWVSNPQSANTKQKNKATENIVTGGTREKVVDWVLGALPIASLLGLWHLVAVFGDVPTYLLPAPLDVAETFWEELVGGNIALHVQLSLSHYLLGLGAGIALGVPLGLLVGSVSLASKLLEPLVSLLRPIPPLAWIPFAILVIGINTQAAAFIIGLGAFYINFYNTLAGVRSIDRKLVEAARTLGDHPLGIIWRVVVPSALPHILTGIRISIGQGWMTVVAAEMFGIRGLGQRLMDAAGLLAMEIVITYMIVIGVIHLGMDLGFRWIESYILRWR